MPAIAERRVHLGAHKTATTHLQESLSHLHDELRRQRMAYLETAQVRPVLEEPGPAPRVEAALRALVPLHPEGGRLRVALSEENLLGPLADLLEPEPYPRLGPRVAVLAGFQAPVSAFLSIRSFDRVLAGAYATALRHRRGCERVLGARDAIFAREPPRWADLVERIEASAPGLPLRVWRQEDYAQRPRRFAAALLGRKLGNWVRGLPPRTTMTPSAEAIAEVEAWVARGENRQDPEGWRDRVNALYAARPAAEGTPFRPFGPEAEARFAAAYEADLAAIRARPGCLVELE